MRATGVKDKIGRAAIELFATHGVDGVSIAEIAVAARVSQGALYRHYRSKDELAEQLFAAAYRQAGEELTAIGAAKRGFAARIAAMVAHFCALYDRDAPLFRFMLLAQHKLLPRVDFHGPGPATAVQAAVAEAAGCGEIAAVDSAAATAAILGIVLQTAVFHVYGRIGGPLAPRAPALARAAVAAVAALAGA
ncbi:MAG TPA: helix-turn-helix domain-containing protein [Stellaceae bacterium]|nr:helix-turn-helix domain-containing protein [Stellaceae bacterium]